MTVRWNADDEIYVGRVQEIPDCTGHGSTEAEAISMLRENLEDWIEFALERNTPIPLPFEEVLPSGKWLQRVPKTLHRDLIKCAEGEGVSLNMYVTSCLSRSVGASVQSSIQPKLANQGEVPSLSAVADLLGVYRSRQSVSLASAYRNRLHALLQVQDDLPYGSPFAPTAKVVAAKFGANYNVFVGLVASQIATHSLDRMERSTDGQQEAFKGRGYTH